MIKAVVFDMYETLVTLFESKIYMGHEIAQDIGIPEAKFREIWDESDNDRAIGKRTFEDVIEESLRVNNVYSKKLLDKITAKRIESKEECFKHINKDIIPLFEELKKRGIKIGLITNCFWEEYHAIRSSDLYRYFDVVCMSCELGMKKPDTRIFELCRKRLDLQYSECLYVGDGGSRELETAGGLGMSPLQAVWYLKDGVGQPVGRKPEFEKADTPLDVLLHL